jgi:hypothetical protein
VTDEVTEDPADTGDADTGDADTGDADTGDDEVQGSAGEGPADLASGQAQIDPWGAFDEPPFDVEVPTGVGEAILVLGDQRIELETGQCRGGPVYAFADGTVEEARAAQGVFRFEGGARDPDTDLGVLFLVGEGTTAEGFDDQVMVRRRHQFDIAFPSLPIPTSIQYLAFPDGSVLEGLEGPNTSWAQAPAVAVSRDGLVTAQGTVDRSAAEEIEAPVEVTFAARCPQGWIDAIDELEASER